MPNHFDYQICDFIIHKLSEGKGIRECLAETIAHGQQILELTMAEKPNKYYIISLDKKTYYGIVSLYGSNPSIYATTIRQEAILHYESDLPRVTALLNAKKIEHDCVLYDNR